MKTMIKSVGSSGQISLGKEHSGKMVLVEQIDTGVWLVKLGVFVPDNERWLQQSDVKSDLDEAITWAEHHPPKPCDLEALAARIQS
jgi:hypothetical protein